jgi:hypothetical protein
MLDTTKQFSDVHIVRLRCVTCSSTRYFCSHAHLCNSLVPLGSKVLRSAILAQAVDGHYYFNTAPSGPDLQSMIAADDESGAHGDDAQWRGRTCGSNTTTW